MRDVLGISAMRSLHFESPVNFAGGGNPNFGVYQMQVEAERRSGPATAGTKLTKPGSETLATLVEGSSKLLFKGCKNAAGKLGLGTEVVSNSGKNYPNLEMAVEPCKFDISLQ